MSGLIEQRQSLHRQLESNELRIKGLEEQIHATQKMATLGTMISVVAHEFNNILVPMINYSELALKNPDDTALMRKALTKTVEHGNRAATMIKSMLSMASQHSDDRESVTVASIVDECLQCLTRDLAKDRVHVEMDIPEGLAIYVAPNQLLQVLFNLVINARQAMAERGGNLKISATQERQGTTRILVTDSGCGIAPEMIEKIFDPFVSTKTDATEPRRKGTGLGLMICREIVEAHGGQLTVASEPGQGATFTIELPPAPHEDRAA